MDVSIKNYDLAIRCNSLQNVQFIRSNDFALFLTRLGYFDHVADLPNPPSQIWSSSTHYLLYYHDSTSYTASNHYMRRPRTSALNQLQATYPGS